MSLHNLAPSKSKDFIEKALMTRRYHSNKLKENPKWTLRDSAKLLRRSIGSISEDLLIASWCKTHLSRLEKFDYAVDALLWIRKMKKSQMVDED